MGADGTARVGHLTLNPRGSAGVDLGHLDVCPVRGEQGRYRRADAVAATGDDRNPAVQQSIPVGDGRHTRRPRAHSGGAYARQYASRFTIPVKAAGSADAAGTIRERTDG